MQLDNPSSQAGHSFLAIKIDSFADDDAFRAELGGMLKALREAEPVEGAERVMVPGQREWETRREREANGIPLHPKLLARLDRFADEIGTARLTDILAAAT